MGTIKVFQNTREVCLYTWMSVKLTCNLSCLTTKCFQFIIESQGFSLIHFLCPFPPALWATGEADAFLCFFTLDKSPVYVNPKRPEVWRQTASMLWGNSSNHFTAGPQNLSFTSLMVFCSGWRLLHKEIQQFHFCLTQKVQSATEQNLLCVLQTYLEHGILLLQQVQLNILTGAGGSSTWAEDTVEKQVIHTL